jgi:hypothetical protein
MNNQKSRRLNRKQIKRKTIKRKTIKRKTIKRKTIKRKTIKRKQNKKIAYNQKKMHGGKFNETEEDTLKLSLERFNFSDEELKEVITILGLGSQQFWGNNLEQLIAQIETIPNKEEFMEWLSIDYNVFAEQDETDYEDGDEDEDGDEEDED